LASSNHFFDFGNFMHTSASHTTPKDFYQVALDAGQIHIPEKNVTEFLRAALDRAR